MSYPASIPTRWPSRMHLGLVLIFLGLSYVLPMKAVAQGGSPVQSLIEQGQKANADTELMRTVASRAQASGLDAEATADLLRPAVALAEQDLPSSPLLTKTLEGLAKQVPASRMSPVLQRVQTHTEEAGALVSSWASRSEVQSLLGTPGEGPPKSARDQLITNIAEARQQDLPLQSVEQFLNELPNSVQRRPLSVGNVATAVSVMSELPGAKDRPEVARSLVTSALNAGYDAESIRQLPVALEQAQRTSQRPATSLAQGTARAIAKGTPASNVLKSLFQGAPPQGGLPSQVGDGPPASPPGQSKPPGPPESDRPDNPSGGDGPSGKPPSDTPSGGQTGGSQ